MKSIAGIAILASILGLIVGILLWANVFDSAGALPLVGCIIFFTSFAILLMSATWNKVGDMVQSASKPLYRYLVPILTVLGAIFLGVAVFSAFAYLHLILNFPYTETSDTVFGSFFVALIIPGSGAEGGDWVIIYIIKKRR